MTLFSLIINRQHLLIHGILTRILDKMMNLFTTNYGNPSSSTHTFGKKAN